MPARYAARGQRSELQNSEFQDSALLRDAIRTHRKGLPSEALGKYEAHLEQTPNCLDGWMNLGAVYAQAGRATEAAQAFRRAALLAPNDGRVFRDIGLGLHTIGRLEQAAAALERSVECAPELIGSWLHLARTRLEVAERPLAIAAAKRATELNPDDASAALVLARCLFDAEDPQPALDVLARLRTAHPSHPEARVFHQLIAACYRGADVERSGEPLSQGLQDLVSAQPRVADLVDAMVYLYERMPEARLFSSARDTLRFAESQAPRDGNIVELGVFHGVSLRWLVERRPGVVHGFDSFTGLPSGWERVPMGRFTTAGHLPEALNAQFWVGNFEDQLPRFVVEHPEPLALLHVDSDLYESARSGFKHLGPLLVPGSVIVFDEYLGNRNWRQDEYRAFQEAVAERGWRYEYLAANPFTGQVVVRLLEG